MRSFPTRIAVFAVTSFTVAFMLFALCTNAVAQKQEVLCPVQDIVDRGILGCPDVGCGTVDPLLNQRKNVIAGDTALAEHKSFQYLADLPKRMVGYDKVGDPRDALTQQGEGLTIRFVAYALEARKGGKESCNCGLKAVKNTDNHIVLVDEATLDLTAKATKAKPASGGKKAVKARSAQYNTLKRREKESLTAEFTPRVRVDHSGLAGTALQSLIKKAPKKALLVRVTGVQLYDSEHALGKHLIRLNDWEIHPVLKLEYCPNGKTCTDDSDTNWISLDGQ